MGGGVTQVMLQGGEGAQVLQVLSLKDATVLTKAMQVKAERDAVVTDSQLLTLVASSPPPDGASDCPELMNDVT